MELQTRKPNRLENYDYSQEGCYFLTLCTHNRQNLFILEHDRVGNDLREIMQFFKTMTTNEMKKLSKEEIEKLKRRELSNNDIYNYKNYVIYLSNFFYRIFFHSVSTSFKSTI